MFSPGRWAVSVTLCFLWKDKTPPRPHRPHPSRSSSPEPCPIPPCAGRSASWGLWTLRASSPAKENQTFTQQRETRPRPDVAAGKTVLAGRSRSSLPPSQRSGCWRAIVSFPAPLARERSLARCRMAWSTGCHTDHCLAPVEAWAAAFDKSSLFAEPPPECGCSSPAGAC